MVDNHKPGDGERSAMLGYVPQYQIAAHKIYDSLINGTLDWFRVADPNAGHVDDIFIATQGRIDAYQVKWAEFIKDEFSYKEFIRNNKAKPSLFMQLVDGWKQISNDFPERKVRVHLLHKQVPSPNPQAKLPKSLETPRYNHFQGFLKDCWLDRSWCAEGMSAVPKGWAATFDELKVLSNLGKDFLSFVSECELKFNYRLPIVNSNGSRVNQRRKKDVDEIYKFLTKMAGDEQRVIELSKDELLERLSWTKRFKQRFIHEFPIEKTYQEITETVNSLGSALANINQGYVALLGSPGSGKSTTLTRTLKYKKGFRLVRYYAFVPDSPSQGRGEANNFLQDITLSLRQHGFKSDVVGQSQPESREELQALLGEQLQQASLKWSEDNIVTLIMVDGLDHIQREQNPLQSLLADLPHPDSIPKGVVVLLGSQTLELEHLSDAIRVQLNEINRVVTMSPLMRQDVFSILDRFSGEDFLEADCRSAIYEKSSGHPLSLIYLLQLIDENPDSECVDLLTKVPEYQDSIEQSYSIHWNSIESNHDLVELLALLSRIRVPININEIESWVKRETIKGFITQASHYFRKDEMGVWSFFHNSFRQFILDKTGKNLFSNEDKEKNILYHRKLAELCSNVDKKSFLYYENIHHLFNANKFDDIISLGTQEYFRQQFFYLRCYEDIISDITYLLLSAKKQLEPIAIVRCLLIEAELNERSGALDQIDLLGLICDVNGPREALRYVFDGQRLRISNDEALQLVKQLINTDDVPTAKIIFDASEPLGYLSGSEIVENSSDSLKKWVDVAYYFMNYTEIISAIKQVRFEKNDMNLEITDSHHHYSLIRRLARSVYSSNDEEKINLLISTLETDEEFYDHLLDISFSICQQRYPDSQVQVSLNRILEWSKSKDISESEKISIAELIFRINSDSDSAKKWIKGLNQPSPYKDHSISQWSNLSPFVDRIKLNRLMSALGCAQEPTDAVPDAVDKKNHGNVLYERFLVKFSNIWGSVWAKECDISCSEIVSEIKPVINLLQKSYVETRDWTAWYQLSRSAVDFYAFTISVASACSSSHVLAIAKVFASHWETNYWSTNTRRKVALALYEEGWDKSSLIKTLISVEVDISKLDEVNEQVEEYAALASTWSNIGEELKAKALLPKIIQGSFGINHRKDRQFSHWVSWLGKMIEQHPELVHEDIRRFSSAVVSLEYSGNGRGTSEAARDLIAYTTAWDAKYGLEIFKWLIAHNGIHYVSGITGIVLGMLRRKHPSYKEIVTFTTKLLILFEEHNPSDLAETIAFNCHNALSKDEAAHLVGLLVESISTHLLPSNRYSWWKGIVSGLRKAGCDNPEYSDKALVVPKDKHVTHEPSIILHTKEKLTDEEAQLKVGSIDGLINLIKNVESIEYFRWFDLIKPYMDTINLTKINELYDLLIQLEPEHKAISAIANRFIELGDVDKANSIIEDLLNSSDAKGWDTHWDGGSRQSTFKVLIAINPNKWRPIALNSLVDDYIGGYRYPSSLIWSLEDIVNIIFENPELPLIWQEISDHVYQLTDFNNFSDFPPSFSVENTKSLESEVLVRLAFKFYDCIVPEIYNSAYQTIVEFIRISEDRAVLSSEIKHRLSKIGLPQVKALTVLKGVSNDFSDYVKTFNSEISTLAASNDLSVRLIAQELSETLSITPASISEDKHKLPFAYEIELPELENLDEAIPYTAIVPGDTFPDIGDPLELIRPFSNVAEILSKMSGIPLQNVVTRAANLMPALVPEEEWNKNAEVQAKNKLKGIGLEMTYNRLRPQIAKLALSHVASELLDAEKIALHDFMFLKKLFNRADNYVLDLVPVERPEFVIVHSAKDRNSISPNEDWLANAEEAIPLILKKDSDNRSIIGELTNWCWLEWAKPTELRMSMVCHKEYQELDEPKYSSSFFPYASFWTASDYPDIGHVREPSLVIYGAPHTTDLGSSEWLALNPIIGVELGWSYDNQGCFRWVNDSGEVMVESIYWKDGPISRMPPKFDNVCSNGWLVVATAEAMESIQQLTGEIIKMNVVVRSSGKNAYDLEYGVAESRELWR